MFARASLLPFCGLLIFCGSLYAGEKPDSTSQLGPMVAQGATVRGLTRPFEAMVDSQRVYFENGLHFIGEVLWLDQYFLDLKTPNAETYLKIPLPALIKLELRNEKTNWPLTVGTLAGLAVGLTVPIDESEDKNIRSLKRISFTAGGMALGFTLGLLVKNMLPTKWQDIPLEQARLGIKK